MFGNLDKILRVNLDQSELILVANKSSILNHTTAIDYDIRYGDTYYVYSKGLIERAKLRSPGSPHVPIRRIVCA